MEGKVPVPPFCLRAEQDDDTLPVQEGAYLGGRSSRGEIPRERSTFHQRLKYVFFKGDLIPMSVEPDKDFF